MVSVEHGPVLSDTILAWICCIVSRAFFLATITWPSGLVQSTKTPYTAGMKRRHSVHVLSGWYPSFEPESCTGMDTTAIPEASRATSIIKPGCQTVAPQSPKVSIPSLMCTNATQAPQFLQIPCLALLGPMKLRLPTMVTVWANHSGFAP